MLSVAASLVFATLNSSPKERIIFARWYTYYVDVLRDINVICVMFFSFHVKLNSVRSCVVLITRMKGCNSSLSLLTVNIDLQLRPLNVIGNWV